ncbi:MAG: thiazole biosynthesis protein [Crenarchaeota archaeon]|nr:thiazole biosynthesis protein [Thermoproteota archaeon]
MEEMEIDLKGISEKTITQTIVRHGLRKLESIAQVDVAIVGAGPSGMSCAYYLAREGVNVLVVERRLSFGGGIGGGGMLIPAVVVQKSLKNILEKDFNIRYIEDGDVLVVDPAELIAKLATAALNAGAKFLLGVTVEDILADRERKKVTGIVINWTAVHLSQLWVDPLFIRAQAVVDATGHEASVVRIAAKKLNVKIDVLNEGPAIPELADDLIVKYSKKIIPGLYTTGMATAAVYKLPRMGPIFGGMLLSGKKVAEEILKELREQEKTAEAKSESS